MYSGKKEEDEYRGVMGMLVGWHVVMGEGEKGKFDCAKKKYQ